MRHIGSGIVSELGTRVLVSVLAVAAWAAPATAHGPDGKGSAAFEAYEAGDIPSRFKGLENPLPSTEHHALAGRRLYEDNCVMCHGVNAEGDGHMAQMMDAKPADLRRMLRHFPALDDYYYWIISAGGARFDLPMPGFEDTLTDTQIWQLITWMQAGFPGAGTDIEDRMHPHHDQMHGQDHRPEHHMGGAGGEPMPDMPKHEMPHHTPTPPSN